MIERQFHGESVAEGVPSDSLKVVRCYSCEFGRESGRPDGIDNLATWVALGVRLDGDELHGTGWNFKASLFLEFARGALFKRFAAGIKEATNEAPSISEGLRLSSPLAKQHEDYGVRETERDY